jgi:hypothetical protein
VVAVKVPPAGEIVGVATAGGGTLIMKMALVSRLSVIPLFTACTVMSALVEIVNGPT